MGFKLAKVEISGKKVLKPNEERELSIVLKPEKKAAIHGVVRFPNGRPAKNAVVKLFQKCQGDPCLLKPITFAFTDECGQFLFGVPSGMEFVIKVFFFKPEQQHKMYEEVDCEEEMCFDDDDYEEEDCFCPAPKKYKKRRKHHCYDDEDMCMTEDDY